MLSRIHLMYGERLEGPYEVDIDRLTDEGTIELKGPVAEPEYKLVVVDEGHVVYEVPDNRDAIEQRVAEGVTRFLILSDLSQSSCSGEAPSFPPEVNGEVVELTEVVRSTKRIVAAAMQFQTTGQKHDTRR